MTLVRRPELIVETIVGGASGLVGGHDAPLMDQPVGSHFEVTVGSACGVRPAESLTPKQKGPRRRPNTGPRRGRRRTERQRHHGNTHELTEAIGRPGGRQILGVSVLIEYLPRGSCRVAA
jgi:hypothetical protein